MPPSYRHVLFRQSSGTIVVPVVIVIVVVEVVVVVVVDEAGSVDIVDIAAVSTLLDSSVIAIREFLVADILPLP